MAKFGEWIEVKWRELDEEEQEYYKDTDIVAMADFETPDDGDEILISQNDGKWISVVTFCSERDYGIVDEDGNDWLYEVDAWMPLPKGFVKDGGKNEV